MQAIKPSLFRSSSFLKSLLWRHIYLFREHQLVETLALPSEAHAADIADDGLLAVEVQEGIET